MDSEYIPLRLLMREGSFSIAFAVLQIKMCFMIQRHSKITFSTLIHKLALIAITLLLTHAPCSAADPSSFMDLQSSINELKPLVDKAGAGIVLIVVYDITGQEIGSGSGFFIDGEGRILTNAFLMKNAYSAEVFSEANHYSSVTVLNRDEDLDLALIQVQAINEKFLELDFNYKMHEGDRIIAIGRSRDSSKTFSEGFIGLIYRDGKKLEAAEIQVAESILSLQPALNGPVLSITGKIIGIMTDVFSDNSYFKNTGALFDKNLYALNLCSVKASFLKSYTIEHLHNPKSRVWHRWLIWWIETKVLEGFIVLYEIGFKKFILSILAITTVISLIQWGYSKIKKSI